MIIHDLPLLRELERVSRRTWITFHSTYFAIPRVFKRGETRAQSDDTRSLNALMASELHNGRSPESPLQNTVKQRSTIGRCDRTRENVRGNSRRRKKKERKKRSAFLVQRLKSRSRLGR